MRKPRYPLTASAVLLLTLLVSVPAAASTVAWYRFDEGSVGSVPSGPVPDYSGNGLSGTAYGTDGPRYVTGLDLAFGKALDFDGTDDRIYVPDSPVLRLTHSLTLEACLNLHSFLPASNSNSFIVWRGDTRGGLDPYTLTLAPTTQELRFWIESLTPGDYTDLRTPFIWLNQPVHVAAVLNGASGFMGLYVNGELRNSTSTTTRPFGPLDPGKKPGLGIGGFWTPTGTAFFLDGVIDEVRISDAPLDPTQFLCSVPPILTWTGEAGYSADGVNPDAGNPSSAASPTTFTFRVRCKQPYLPPTIAQCLIQHCVCGAWQSYKTLPLTAGAGDEVTGWIYSASTQLPNEPFRYLFFFANSRGTASGEPSVYRAGPLLAGPPKLCWSPATGFGTDGVNPNSAKAGTRFRFEVLYTDSAGDAPTLRKLLIRRNGALYRTLTMNPVTGGNYREGMTFYCCNKLTEAGTYEYRFKFRDGSGLATGTPTAWKSGPTITGTSGLALTSLSAVPAPAGAQLTFSLPSPASVTATVLNIAGRPIRTIVADRPLDAGLQTLLWDRRAETGLPAPSGLYLIRVTARDASGGQSTALATLALR
ncbi:MAG: hypothetical protein FJ313_01895 [Gemmatimonadetes bacterium]|nr:hypothetical protein [Gemmatimonadota bacterium]